MEASDIKVTTGSLTAPLNVGLTGGVAADVETSRVIAFIDLQPSGLRFLQPVTVTLRIPVNLVGGPIVVFHIPDDGVEALDVELPSEFDPELIEATVRLESFSELVVVWMWIDMHDLFEVTHSVSRTEVPVTQTFTAAATITRLANDRR